MEINDVTILEALKKGIIDGVDTVKSDFLSENDTDCAERTVDFGASVVNAMDRAIEALKNSPVRHGEWIKVDKFRHVKCSVCESLGEQEENDFYLYAYCPRCGAKMDLRR